MKKTITLSLLLLLGASKADAIPSFADVKTAAWNTTTWTAKTLATPITWPGKHLVRGGRSLWNHQWRDAGREICWSFVWRAAVVWVAWYGIDKAAALLAQSGWLPEGVCSIAFIKDYVLPSAGKVFDDKAAEATELAAKLLQQQITQALTAKLSEVENAGSWGWGLFKGPDEPKIKAAINVIIEIANKLKISFSKVFQIAKSIIPDLLPKDLKTFLVEAYKQTQPQFCRGFTHADLSDCVNRSPQLLKAIAQEYFDLTGLML